MSKSKPAYLIAFPLASLALLFSCEKNSATDSIPPAASQSYAIKIQMDWRSPAFTIPPGAHFTTIAGIVHNENTALWLAGDTASKGLENVAEVGSIVAIQNEFLMKIEAGTVKQAFFLPAPAITGVIDTSLLFTSSHARISFASMIAPSPDWFIAINNLSLLQQNKWIDSLTIPIYLYDAGTEEGDVFGYNNLPTNPLQPLRLLTPVMATVLANANSNFAPIGTIRFIKN